uniref:Uncharacterized protein n=1 Tax=Arundo donax TaxID=35708 RepID=A0A0A9E669_ARUDO
MMSERMAPPHMAGGWYRLTCGAADG